ncbi:ribbon-helix-helix protein, CopG family [Acidobacteria bacterium AH-259-L09]|nr:ribbon-helix-helix protein, CopG family [Acidobacteria bacterium AH-259-L09]
MLDTVCGRSGRNRSEVIREALRRQLNVLIFEELRRRVMPFAGKHSVNPPIRRHFSDFRM